MIKIQLKIGKSSAITMCDYDTLKKKIEEVAKKHNLTIEDMRIVGIIEGEKENEKN